MGRTGQQLARATPKKAYRLPEAREAAAAAVEVLQHHFQGAEWIDQARAGMEIYIERCIMQFSATPTPRNNAPIAEAEDYRAYARSAEEIKETIAAEEAAVTNARNVPRYRERPDEVEIPEQEMADPMRQQKPPGVLHKPPTGWAL